MQHLYRIADVHIHTCTWQCACNQCALISSNYSHCLAEKSIVRDSIHWTTSSTENVFFILLYQKSGRICQTNLFFPHCHYIWCAYTPISIFFKKHSLSGRHWTHSDYTILSCHFCFLAKYQLLPYTLQCDGDCLTESFAAIWICISDNIRASADLCWRCGELMC